MNAALDTTATVITPENIAFDYQLAGPFRRLPAYAIDLVVRGVALFLALIAVVIAGSVLSLFSLQSFALAAFMIGNFLLSFFYGAICESYFNGRTAGKAICGIRVIGIDGRPISGRAAIIRNLLRPADMMPMAPIMTETDVTTVPMYLIPTAMVGLAVMLSTARMQRLGDLAAGTMVIVDEKIARLPFANMDDARVPALASFIPPDYRVSQSMSKMLASYTERRKYLSPARRREIARHLAMPLIDRFKFRDDVDPDLLMVALYYRTFLRDDSVGEDDLGDYGSFSPLAADVGKTTHAAATPPPLEMATAGASAGEVDP